jgi:hypothetical protein
MSTMTQRTCRNGQVLNLDHKEITTREFLPDLSRERENYLINRAKFNHPVYDHYFVLPEEDHYKVIGVKETDWGRPYEHVTLEEVPG